MRPVRFSLLGDAAMVYDPTERIGRVLIGSFERVSVGVQRRGGLCVSKASGNFRNIHTLFQQQRSSGMPEFMRVQRRDVVMLGKSLYPCGHMGGRHCAAIRAHKNIVLCADPRIACRKALFPLPRSVAAQQRKRFKRQHDLSRPACFHRSLNDSIRGRRHKRAVDHHRAGVEVDL